MLGPLDVLFNGEPVVLPAGKGRVLLATLLLRPNQFVSVDELVERLWEGSPPSLDRAAKTLQTTVLRLRQSLGAASCVTTVTNGYVAETQNVDLLRFRALANDHPHAALALWRGPALTNVSSDTLHHEDVPRLVEERLVVLERRIEQDLNDGHATELLPELRSLTTAHPLRERFWAQLMVALYRSDQQAAALDVFHRVSDLLAEELGIDPGASLRNLHQSILRGEPMPAARREIVVPRQLPPDLARFTGREEDIAQLDHLLPTGTAGQAVVISAIAGSAGVGKTALAVHWAHRVRSRFPDGQLAVNLRGYDRDEPLSPHDALGQLLRGLGLSSGEIPGDTEQRVGVYRSLLADRRVLVLLDNARTANQVRPLLPAGGRSVVVVTSRSDLRGLVALNDAKVLRLGTLPLDDAVQLLERVIGADRTQAEPDATVQLARLCACLPLALRIAASMLASEPHRRIQDLLDRLTGENRLAELEIGDDRAAAVRAAFDLSCEQLAPDELRMFRLLGLAPRADFTPRSAGALLGVPSSRALTLLRALARAHLVEEYAPMRFSLHDLLQLHGRECAKNDETADDRRAAVVRFLDHYLHSVDRADRAIRQSRTELPLTEREPVVEVVEFAGRDEALAWFRREHDVLVEICEFALAEEHLEHAWQLPTDMWGYLHIHGSSEDFIRLNTIALEAARRVGNRFAEAVALSTLGSAHKNVYRHDESLRLLHEALRIRQEIGHVHGIAVTTGELAATYLWLERHDESLRYSRMSVEHRRMGGDEAGWAMSMNSLAWVLCVNRHFAEAVDTVTTAIEVMDRLGRHHPTMLDTLAQAHAGLGDLDEAVRIYRDIIASGALAHDGNREKVEILTHAAEIFGRAGDREAALSCARDALILAERSGQARVEKVRQVLRELEG
ncbi:BTAD domain-containing putative transcriptional regulator [Lentzea sp. BCCO 10_0856]|uniref:BTAD domain-containing putative transcriptional regulator n=1 Tax=Lentzea miocenica TaxID=3095431 RepID=A0ABU4T2F4_9PSEU|nr:BTAD domain-containing putative transcriptional regulator [Lentzea sp. BCCO 10_0856]MDX8032345.1 BTAD domain-containing putative transcriptional regulator [Lentzea sp. BCCO 10_0856]